MKKSKILIVEDDQNYHDRYKRWLNHDNYSFLSAFSAAEAINLLSKQHFSIVLLDLALDPDNPNDRSSHEVAAFLLGSPDKTKHILISGHAQTADAINAAFHNAAFYVIEKRTFETDDEILVNKVKEAVEKYRDDLDSSDFVGRYYKTLLSNNVGIMETQAANTLQPNAFPHIQELFTGIVKEVAPLAQHRSKHPLSIHENERCLFGLFWSLEIGKPLSVCVHNENRNPLTVPEVKLRLENYLGWAPGSKIHSMNHKGLEVSFFDESDHIDAKEFILREPT
jgi:ActR/RegA family two-component response regulator